ncbi:MAG: hypothetical protein ABIJ59_16440 [Pseudomonadota bacterium]
MENVTNIKQKLHSRKLATNYQREERENRDLRPEYITDEIASFCPPQCAVAKDNPLDGYELSYQIDVQDITPYFNSLLIYRILKLLYGKPEILGAVFSISGVEGSKMTIEACLDWGYTIRIENDLLAEVRSIHNNTRVKLRYWIKTIPKTESHKKAHVEKMDTFYQVFLDCLEKNTHLFEEEGEITDDKKSKSAFSNVFVEKYNSAKQTLDLAKNIDQLPEKRDITWDENVAISTGGALYLTSAILFIIALEALINTIYHLLLKPAFHHKVYERATVRMDLDLRIISAHVFCDGFAKPILTPGTELWDRLLKLRDFRNDVIHGNIKSDHYAYVLPEDKFLFFYSGATDFRGRKTEKKAKKKYPTRMSLINLNVVSEIKDTVDQIIQAVRQAADDDNKLWLDSWLWEAVIQKINMQKR